MPPHLTGDGWNQPWNRLVSLGHTDVDSRACDSRAAELCAGLRGDVQERILSRPGCTWGTTRRGGGGGDHRVLLLPAHWGPDLNRGQTQGTAGALTQTLAMSPAPTFVFSLAVGPSRSFIRRMRGEQSIASATKPELLALCSLSPFQVTLSSQAKGAFTGRYLWSPGSSTQAAVSVPSPTGSVWPVASTQSPGSCRPSETVLGPKGETEERRQSVHMGLRGLACSPLYRLCLQSSFFFFTVFILLDRDREKWTGKLRDPCSPAHEASLLQLGPEDLNPSLCA